MGRKRTGEKKKKKWYCIEEENENENGRFRMTKIKRRNSKYAVGDSKTKEENQAERTSLKIFSIKRIRLN